MLVLSRKVGQALLLGPDVEITVLRIEGDQVRLGVKAPRQLAVLREELLEEVRRETETASIASRKPVVPGAELRQLAQRIKKLPSQNRTP
jgi:carbon storage regulator